MFRSTFDLPAASERMDLADLDGDRDLDVVATRAGELGAFVVLRNDLGAFASVPQSGRLLGRFSLGDLDRDGDPDVLDAQRARFNQVRSLSYRGAPRIAQPLSLVLRGHASQAYVLFASRGLAPRVTPPYGLRQIDPGQATLVAAGILDGEGRAEWTRPVPAQTALVGVTWHWQALLPGPLRWSSLETTTLTRF